MRRAVLFMAVVAGLVAAAPASAQSPAGCLNNRLHLDLLKDKNLVKNGDVVNYRVEIENTAFGGCDVSGVTIKLRFPAPDGTSTGTETIVTTNAAFGFPTPKLTWGPFPYTVNRNAGVPRLEARAFFENAILHDNVIPSDLDDDNTVGLIFPTPGIEVDKTADIKSGLAPQRVTYTFKVYNRTSPALTLDNVTLDDDKCQNVVGPVAGDDGDRRLQPTEVWEYRCTMDHGVGVFTNTATACAELFVNGGPMPKVCDTDDETVEFTPPPGNPPASPPPAGPPAETAVKPANATQSPCTLSTPKGLQVRAKELTSIKATVRQVDAGTTVKITLPGGKTVSAKTNSKGVAILKVRPPKTGTARITVAECSEVKRLTVRAARKTQSRRVPRVTG